MRRLCVACGTIGVLLVVCGAAHAGQDTFEMWLDEIRVEAAGRGLACGPVGEALKRATYTDRVVELDRRQPELTQTFWRYFDPRVTPERVAKGQANLRTYEPLLTQVYELYGVQPQVIAALWGLESDYGRSQGDFEVISSVATLAFDSRRSSFFRQQLFALLELMCRGDVSPDMVGSWAGAMGQPQFIPTTLRDYAMDFDGDGVRDLRNSLPDVFASAANYLAANGWNEGGSWGQEVWLDSQHFDYLETGLDVERSVFEWQRLGVRSASGGDLAETDLKASVLLPAGAKGPAFLVYSNFRSILRWNNSVLYALAVGHLSDRIAGGAPLTSPRPAEEVSISRSDLIEMQAMLTRLGFESGEPDGLVGERTRRAIRSFQQSIQAPADGYPDAGLLEQLRIRFVN